MGYGTDVEDWGGYFADQDARMYELEEIDKDRLRREKELRGKYVISCKGNKSKKKCYLQDRRISKGGWWTQYLSNALGFDTIIEAERVCRGFKYNSPKVERV